MAFVPNTDSERKEMLNVIGVSSFDDLIVNIPEEIRLKEPLNMYNRLSELEVLRLMEKYSKENITPSSHVCFMGGGA